MGGRTLIALLAAALPLFSSAQILDGPSPWDIAVRIWVFGLGFVSTVLLAWGARRLIWRPPKPVFGASRYVGTCRVSETRKDREPLVFDEGDE